MKKFKFNGNWDTELNNLKHFSSNFINNFSSRKNYLEIESDKISIIISDKYGDYSPDPSISQIDTINFILDEKNQIQIIESFIGFLNKEIYPFYQEKVFSKEEYPEAYPEIVSINDYYKNFRIKLIYILNENKNQLPFILYLGSRGLDNEHGLTVKFDGSKCLNHGNGDGELFLSVDESKIAQEYRKEYHSMLDNEEPIMHKPHPKYGKLKPWQIDSNRRFAFNAYRKYNDEDFIKAILKENIDLSKFKYFYSKAKEDNRVIIIKYFEKEIL